MSTVYFATSNAAKFAAAVDAFSPYLVKVQQIYLDLVEPQSLDVKKIVESKVDQAYAAVGVPVMVEDTAVGFDGLGGFPGPFIRYAIETMGADGLLRAMHGQSCRGVTIDSVAALTLDGTRTLMTRTVRTNYHVTHALITPQQQGWSDIWTILEPISDAASAAAEPTSIAKLAHLLNQQDENFELRPAQMDS